MTAEVAILNKSAVALAADSKVTVGGAGSEKTYDTVNKIFTLSKVHPIGVMIYGNAEFMEYPWETIIKDYRNGKRGQSKDYVEDWGSDLLRYVRALKPIRQSDRERNIQRILEAEFTYIEQQARIAAHMRGVPIASPAHHAIMIEMLDARIEEAQSAGPFVGTKEGNNFINKYWKFIRKTVFEFFSLSAKTPLGDRAIECAIYVLFSRVFSTASSGIVVAGFGKKEMFPAVISYTADGYVGTRVKVSQGRKHAITLDTPSGVYAFAQYDIVHRFMEGIDPGYSETLQGCSKRLWWKVILKHLKNGHLKQRRQKKFEMRCNAPLMSSTIIYSTKRVNIERKSLFSNIGYGITPPKGRTCALG